MELLFAIQPKNFPSDAIKIATVGTLLSGTALEGFANYVECPGDHPELFQSWKNFKTLLQETFGEHDRATVTANRLLQLRQGNSSANQYATKFQQHAAELDWDNNALIHHFKLGLNQNVRDLPLHHEIPKTLTAMVNLAITLDHRVQEHRQEQEMINQSTVRQVNTSKRESYRRGDYRPRNSFPLPTRPSFSQDNRQPIRQAQSCPMAKNVIVIPMDLDAMARNSPIHQAPVDNSERERRRAQNLCFYCGEPDHTKFNCPQLQSRKGKAKKS